MNSVGSKIKVMTVTLTVIGLIACLIMFFMGVSAYEENKDYLEYATIYGGADYYYSLEKAGNEAYDGMQLRNTSLTLAGCILVSMLPLYGFGVMVENSETQTELLAQIASRQKSMDASLTDLRSRAAMLSAMGAAAQRMPQSASPGVSSSRSQRLPEL